MILTKLAASAVTLALFITSALAQDSDPAVVEASGIWAACQETVAIGNAADPIGWRRDFGNGYGDSLFFYDLRYDQGVSAVMTTRNIDAIVFETETSCYRPDGTLAWVALNASAPDAMMGVDGPIIERWGSIGVAPDGKVILNQGSLSDVNGANLGGVNSPDHALARPCGPVDLRLTLDAVQTQIESVLGDIDGQRPVYTPNEFAWCDTSELGPGPAF